MEFLEIDGSFGEGGGQIVRTAITLSCILNQPITIKNIRNNRKNPGLKPQHFTALKILKKAEGSELTSGRGPAGIAAAGLYVAALLNNEKKTQREVADVAGITEVTIRNRYKELIDKLGLEEKNYFVVTAKCGHVGNNKYVIKNLTVIASSKK